MQCMGAWAMGGADIGLSGYALIIRLWVRDLQGDW